MHSAGLVQYGKQYLVHTALKNVSCDSNLKLRLHSINGKSHKETVWIPGLTTSVNHL